MTDDDSECYTHLSIKLLPLQQPFNQKNMTAQDMRNFRFLVRNVMVSTGRKIPVDEDVCQ